MNKQICLINDNLNNYNKLSPQIIKIKHSFRENIRRNYIHIHLPTLIEDILSHYKNPINDYSIYEVLDGVHLRRFYFDIEKITEDKETKAKQIVIDIAENFSKFILNNYDDKNIKVYYHITTNINSPTHKGYSFHLIFPFICANYKDMNYIVVEFLEEYPEYKDYIDLVVYSRVRLFKLPCYFGIVMDRNNGTEEISDINSNNYHKLDEKCNNLSEKEFKRFVTEHIITYINADTDTIFKLNNIFNISLRKLKSIKRKNNWSGPFINKRLTYNDNKTEIISPFYSTVNVISKDEINKIYNEKREIIKEKTKLQKLDYISNILNNNPTQTDLIMVNNLLNLI